MLGKQKQGIRLAVVPLAHFGSAAVRGGRAGWSRRQGAV